MLHCTLYSVSIHSGKTAQVNPSEVAYFSCPSFDNAFVQDMLAVVDRFAQYSVLWNQDRDAELKAFLESDPRLTDFEEKFCFYEELEKRFLSEPECCVIGPVAIHTGNADSVCVVGLYVIFYLLFTALTLFNFL